MGMDLRVEGTGVELRLFGQRLAGDFAFEQVELPAWIQRMFGIYKCSQATTALCFCHYMQCQCCFTGSFRTVHLYNPAPRYSANAWRCAGVSAGPRHQEALPSIPSAKSPIQGLMPSPWEH